MYKTAQKKYYGYQHLAHLLGNVALEVTARKRRDGEHSNEQISMMIQQEWSHSVSFKFGFF